MTTKSLSVQIIEAFEANDLEVVRWLFEQHPVEKQAFTFFAGGTWLHYAARKSSVEAVELLLGLGIDVNILDRSAERTPLVDAASGGRVEIVRYLLDCGAVMNTEASISNPMIACITGYGGSQDEPRERFATVAKLLIDHGIDLAACYNQQSMVDMDVAAFAYMWGREDITAMAISALYGHDERLSAGAWAEAIEVALGNAFSRQNFRKYRYPPKRGANAGGGRPPGEAWE